MTGAAQHCVYRITERTFEPVPIELAVRLHVTDGRLDRASPADHRAQSARDPASQTRVIDPCAINNDAIVAPINNDHFRLHVAQDRRLLQRLGQRMAVIRIARDRARADQSPSLWVVVIDTLTPNSYGVRALPLARHSTSGACKA